MKTILILAASLFVAAGAFAQGTIIFVNFNANFKAPIYDIEPLSPTTTKTGNSAAGNPMDSTVYTGALLSGTGYTAELWGHLGTGQAEGALEALGKTTFRTGTAAGFINSAILPVPGATLGGATPSQGTFQVRVWNNLAGTVGTWAQVLLNPAVARGKSALLNSGNLGGTGTPGATDPTLENLRSFNIAIVPEPSSIALGVLGLGTLMFLRRRK